MKKSSTFFNTKISSRFCLVVSLVLIIFLNVISAQVLLAAEQDIQTNPPITSQNTIRKISGISVKEIVLDSKLLKPGDVVTGSFVLINEGEESVTDTNYTVSLAGDYQPNTLAGTFYDTQIFGPVFLNANESRTIFFSYTIPKAVLKGEYGIQIQAKLKSGQALGWSDSFISIIESGLAPIIVENAYLEIGKGFYFTLREGPMVKKGETIMLATRIKSLSESGSELTPRMEIFNRTDSGPSLFDSTLDKVKVNSKESFSKSFSLPLFDYKPGVYAGKLSFLDKDGIVISQTIKFRYIIEGPVATIQSITSDKQFGGKDEVVTLTLGLSGTPYDITTGRIPDVGSAELYVSLFNESNEVVFEDTQTIDLVRINGSMIIPSILNSDAGTLRAVAKVTKDGDILASYETNLSSDTLPPKVNVSEYLKSNLGLLAVMVLIIILMFVFIFKYFIKNKNVIAAMIVITGLGISIAILPKESATAAFVVYEQQTEEACPPEGCQPIWNPSLSVNNLNVTNGSFHITGTAVMTVCLNQPSNTLYSVTYPDPSKNGGSTNYTTVTSQSAGPVDHGEASISEQFALGAFPAMTTPGTYRVFLAVYDRRGTSGGVYTFGYTAGYMDYVVTDTGQPGLPGDPNLPGVPTEPQHPWPNDDDSGRWGYLFTDLSFIRHVENRCYNGSEDKIGIVMGNGEGLEKITTTSRYAQQLCTGTRYVPYVTRRAYTDDNGVYHPNRYSSQPSNFIRSFDLESKATLLFNYPANQFEWTCDYPVATVRSGSIRTLYNEPAQCRSSFRLNKNIETSVGSGIAPVALNEIKAVPALGNPGYTCRIDWGEDVFKSYDYYTRCTFDSGYETINFSPASTSAPTFFEVKNVRKDITPRMTCSQMDNPNMSVSKETICRVNWSAVEVN